MEECNRRPIGRLFVLSFHPPVPGSVVDIAISSRLTL
jgi:hypothetical protein